MSLGLCVMGCGSFASIFAQTVKTLRGEIDLYFASRDLSRAQEYSGRFNGIDAFGSYGSAAADPRIDAIYICTPHHLHLELASLAARWGKHILVEKPIAGMLEDARAITAQAKKAGVNLMVAENYRFLSAVQKAKELVDDGTLGRLRLIQVQEQYPFEPSGWRNQAELNGGGVFIDGGIHKASVLAYLAGRPDQVYAVAVEPGRQGLEAEDGIVLMTRSAQGVVGVINHSWSAGLVTARPWVSIAGTRATIYFELGMPWLKIVDGSSEEVIELADDHRGLVPMVREFHQSISEARDPSMTGEQGIEDLALVLKAYESMRLGVPVSLD
jgi:predicted dehydrogenase